MSYWTAEVEIGAGTYGYCTFRAISELRARKFLKEKYGPKGEILQLKRFTPGSYQTNLEVHC